MSVCTGWASDGHETRLYCSRLRSIGSLSTIKNDNDVEDDSLIPKKLYIVLTDRPFLDWRIYSPGGRSEPCWWTLTRGLSSTLDSDLCLHILSRWSTPAPLWQIRTLARLSLWGFIRRFLLISTIYAFNFQILLNIIALLEVLVKSLGQLYRLC